MSSNTSFESATEHNMSNVSSQNCSTWSNHPKNLVSRPSMLYTYFQLLLWFKKVFKSFHLFNFSNYQSRYQERMIIILQFWKEKSGAIKHHFWTQPINPPGKHRFDPIGPSSHLERQHLWVLKRLWHEHLGERNWKRKK